MFEYFKKGFGFATGSIVGVSVLSALVTVVTQRLKQSEGSKED